MKVRYRNVTSLEIRDVENDSDEQSLLTGEVYTADGISRPRWMIEADYQVKKELDELDAITQATEPVLFGHHQRRLTPGEVAMGIESYEHKLGLGAQLDGSSDEEEDDEEEDDDDPVDAPTSPRASRRRPSRQAAGGRGMASTGAQTGSRSPTGGAK